MKEKNIRKIAFAYVGSFAGAGFISGQEIMQFFAKFGVYGILAEIICSLLFFIITLVSIYIVRTTNDVGIENIIAGDKTFFRKFFSVFFNAFFYSVVIIMIAGFGSLMEELTGIDKRLASLIVLVPVFIIANFGAKGVSESMNIIMPGLTILLVIISIFGGFKGSGELFAIANTDDNPLLGNFFLSMLSFMAYNIIVAIAVFNAMYVKTNKKTLIKGAASGIIIYVLIIVSMTYQMIINFPDVQSVSFPMLVIAGKISPILEKSFSILLLAGFFGCIVNLLFTFTVKVNRIGSLTGWKLNLILLVFAYVLSAVGFKELIGIIYPITGYIGFIAVVMVFIHYFKLRFFYNTRIK